jgi:hypothetical protein
MKSNRVAMPKAMLVVLIMFARVGASHAQWLTAHGTPGNTGAARVETGPAKNPTRVADVGHIAPGANPVTGPDGTVYSGNLSGDVIALHPDGAPYRNVR